ncbi:MAG: 2-oxoacid:acceptor oxidoreductase subunit alpha [Spirochaetales bacterium]|nr:2-oxoacid:acceptor oxidoreductase subunit alpha [Spirochaetales bacterium]
MTTREIIPLTEATVRFCGDSGDGMQITGSQFTSTTGLAGNDLMTFPDFPAEIRAPAGTLAGVSGFQIHFSSQEIFTPGDRVDVLVAMNPAALKANLADLRPGGVILYNEDSFDERNWQKVGYTIHPMEDTNIQSNYKIIPVPITKLTRMALADSGLTQNVIDRCKNFFALGLAYWMYDRDPAGTIQWLEAKFKKKPELVEANKKALQAGIHYAETTELFHDRWQIAPAKLEKGVYRNISGNGAIALAMVAASEKSGLPALLASYPITPASDILHQVSQYKNFNIKTFQAEDEIGAMGAALGAAYGGCLGFTTTSGPGMALKVEAINLAVMTELPVVIFDIQRAGPSTGLPTKTEQADLFHVLFGRPGESPLPVLAPSRPADAFQTALEAVQIALTFMTPVIVLSDAYIANGSEPWRLPAMEDIATIESGRIAPGAEPNGYKVYARNPETLARQWAVPGLVGFEHRIGGIEKHELTGNVNYDPINHERMVHTRAAKVAGIARVIPELEVYGEEKGKLLVLGWGSTFGAIRAAVNQLRASGHSVSHAHLRHLNPFPANLGRILESFETVLVPELNLGQLAFVLQGKFLKKIDSLSKVQGRPFLVTEIETAIRERLS